MDWNKAMSTAKGESKKSYLRKDIVCEVIGYPRLAKGDDPGVIHVKEATSGRELYVSIMDAAKGSKRQDAVMQGNMIDDRMRGNLPAGDMIVIESLIDHPGAGATVEEPAFARYVSGLPTDPNKVVQGIITLKGSTQACHSVQAWEPKALTIEEVAQRTEFDAAVEYYLRNISCKNETGQGLPIKEIPGVQYRVINEQGELVGMSPMLINHALDQDLPNEERYKPMSTEEVVREFAAFEAYAQTKIPGCRVEATVFNQYKASSYMTWQHERSPQVAMCKAKSCFFFDDTSMPRYGGGVMACDGILKLSPGKIDPRKGVRVGADNQYATEVWVSGRHAHVHTMIADVNGEQLKIHPGMAIEQPKPRQTQEQGTATQTPQEQLQAPEHHNEEPPIESYEQEVDSLLDEMGEETPSQKFRGPGM
jgi:hypothetical protein